MFGLATQKAVWPKIARNERERRDRGDADADAEDHSHRRGAGEQGDCVKYRVAPAWSATDQLDASRF